jgi:hypothetical protein
MLIEIKTPNEQLDWVIIETSHIVSIRPVTTKPHFCEITLINNQKIRLYTKLLIRIQPNLNPSLT